ncbi:MAG: ATP-dependent DNA helicase [Lachnospiraceae bacterium]|nr:ATP-dependent DNA helicase [Lachnospiraceae bacterium]
MVPQIRISVRSLVEFIERSGDIDNRRKASGGPEVMLEGANIHRSIQRRMGRDYHAEVYLSCTIERPDYRILIDGRADGIIIPEAVDEDAFFLSKDAQDQTAFLDLADTDGSGAYPIPAAGISDEWEPECDLSGKVIIDEIKTTYRDLDRMNRPVKEHLAQARCYAYIVANAAHLSEIGVRMTYCNTETRELRYFDSLYTYDEISAWFKDLVRAYIRFADFETGWKKIRNMSIDAMEFPYAYRSGQKELMGRVYSSIVKGERLFVMAPTGVGKTLANVYPTLKALANDKSDKIFYLTAKTVTRTVAEDCLNTLRPLLRLKSVTITAKEKICPLEKCDCNPDACPYAKGHYDRINDAMYDLLTGSDAFTRDSILEYAQKHTVCPFEFSLDMSLFSDMIICDYNYVFDPNVYLRRFFSETASGRFMFLIDEAHNLTERAMKMYSADLVKEDFLDMKRLVKDTDARLARALSACNTHLLSLKRECDGVRLTDGLDTLITLLLRLNARIEQFLDDHEHFAHSDELLEFYFGVRHFLNIYENMEPSDYVIYTRLEDSGDFSVHLMCANPAKRVRACTDRAVFTVFFSATLLPIEYYRKMLGASQSDPAVYAKSVFDPAKRALFVARDVTSRYKRRSDSEYDKMAAYISAVVSAKPGNYMIFFPSFAMLDNVYEIYMNRYCDISHQDVVTQTSSMSEAQRDDFLARFTGSASDRIEDGAAKDTLIGFCVLGGIFSEGIDLKNDALIGAVIIGTGLPMVCIERDLLKRCYEEMGLDGFAYAYRYPGMNKVLQAAGRVIRTEEDKGVVALLDERFLGRDYLRLFPREWKDYDICRVDDISEGLEEFWQDT